MGSEQHPLRQSGIYRNLPTFDESIRGLKAIVVGATGISGFNTMRSLLDTPDRWATIYALSRSPPTDEMLSLFSSEQQSRIQHVSVDLTSSGEDIASSLTKAKVVADYVFFYGYIHPHGKSAMDPAMADALVEANAPIFDNFLQALPLAEIKPKRILLQTGGKQYGGHIGRARTPFIESDPQPTHLTDNFYYHQESRLFQFCEQNPGTDWNVVMPFGVIGAVPGAGMNMFLPFAIMAAIQAEKGEPLFFGSDIDSWQCEYVHSSARLTGFLSEWAVLEEKCKNQRFNAVDGVAMSWDRFYEELARWYGAVKRTDGPELDESKFDKNVQLAGGENAPLGYGPTSEIKLSRTFNDWVKEPSTRETWDKIKRSSAGKITSDPFNGGVDLVMADFAFYHIGQASFAKVRRFGFSGFVDSMESVFEMYQEMAKMGVIPAPKVDAAKPMI
ncbi:hypothetical protein LTR17_012341 [Elasticomyces elasticus]|nr:hypothetical protein LTR17_012341 [Elasticomyces elasticus]